MKLYIGCAYPPFHAQHHQIMGNVEEWVWVDKYVEHPQVRQWDALNLPVDNNSCEAIYASHLLEHIEHIKAEEMLKHWYSKLKAEGELILNVPDLAWCAQKILLYAKGEKLQGYYNTWAGEHGLLSILYGSQSHEGEYHKSGYTVNYIKELLTSIGFRDLSIWQGEDAHAMGVIIVRAKR